MVPAASVEQVVEELSQRLQPDDIIVEGGNSHYIDDIRRAKTPATRGIHYVDVGTSGGVWGLERGFCQMIGGDPDVVRHLDPLFTTLAPPVDSAPRTAGREGANRGTAERGYLHCGPTGHDSAGDVPPTIQSWPCVLPGVGSCVLSTWPPNW